jgi:hypothetical protein
VKAPIRAKQQDGTNVYQAGSDTGQKLIDQKLIFHKLIDLGANAE